MLQSASQRHSLMLISDAYREMNRELHEAGGYGIAGGGRDRVPMVNDLAKQIDAKTILDYGCGRNEWLRTGLNYAYDLRSYDPCVSGLDAAPEPADIVACFDVLGHVEPECVDAVLDDLQRCTGRMIMLIIETGKAKKILSDGRNAHLIQEPVEWWMPKLMKRWHIRHFVRHARGFLFIAAAYKEPASTTETVERVLEAV